MAAPCFAHPREIAYRALATYVSPSARTAHSPQSKKGRQGWYDTPAAALHGVVSFSSTCSCRHARFGWAAIVRTPNESHSLSAKIGKSWAMDYLVAVQGDEYQVSSQRKPHTRDLQSGPQTSRPRRGKRFRMRCAPRSVVSLSYFPCSSRPPGCVLLSWEHIDLSRCW